MLLPTSRRGATILAALLSTTPAASLIQCDKHHSLDPDTEAEARNRPPVIHSITATPPAVMPDSTTSLVVEAEDPDGDGLDFVWDPGPGSFVGDTGRGDVVWRAPSTVRPCTTRVTVSDRWAADSTFIGISMLLPPDQAPDTRITRMLVENTGGVREIFDFRITPPVLRDSSRVILHFEGTDPDGSVVDFRIRKIRRDIRRGTTLSYPFGGFFTDTQAATPPAGEPVPFLTSNDYWLVVQCRDDRGDVDATPDSVVFEVNVTPVFEPELTRPGDGDRLQWSGQDSLTVRFVARDLESNSFDMAYRFVLDGVWSPVVSRVEGEDELRLPWPHPAPGLHEIVYYVEDPGGRRDTLTATFEVVER